jgi:hypothetical protein
MKTVEGVVGGLGAAILVIFAAMAFFYIRHKRSKGVKLGEGEAEVLKLQQAYYNRDWWFHHHNNTQTQPPPPPNTIQPGEPVLRLPPTPTIEVEGAVRI